MLDVARLFCPFTDAERLCLEAIRYRHRQAISARQKGFHLEEYRRLLFWRWLSDMSHFGPEEQWL